MELDYINTKKAPQAVGPYSQAVKMGEMLFVSGQIPLDPSTGELVGNNAGEQTKQCMKNILAILENEGLTADNFVKATIFVKDLKNFGMVNEAYASFFSANYPARACVEVSALPKGAAVEIEAIAFYK